MERKRSKKLKTRLLGILMSCIFCVGGLLPAAAQPVYAAAGLTTYSTNVRKDSAFCYSIEDNRVTVESIPQEHTGKNITVNLCSMNYKNGFWVREHQPVSQKSNVSFPYTVTLPQKDGSYQLLLSVRNGSVHEMDAYSFRIVVSGGLAFFAEPEYYKNNYEIYSKRSTSETALGYYLQPLALSEVDVPELKKFAKTLVNKNDSDYVKLQKVHDWVAENIWYDYDLRDGHPDDPGTNHIDPMYVLEKRRAVCGGYAALTEELLRALGIPTIEVYGTAGAAHSWNEAYVDGRWVILDTTWDSYNQYRNGVYSEKKAPRHTYFDITLEAISTDHRMLPDDETKFWMQQDFERELSISKTSLTLGKGKTKQLSVKKAGVCKYIDLKEAKITYTSSNKKVATVSKKGKITAKKAGTAVITTKVKLEGITLKFKTTVYVKK
ncbi:MAG: Ig-like domain-containing protein [Blautia sp.]|nr:Ig-like domain-containing protein [Blautia sp.]